VYWLSLALVVVGCESEKAERRSTSAADADGGAFVHPAIADDARCRDCHPAPGDQRPAGPTATAAPSWHVVDCCGEDWDDCGDCHETTGFQPPKFDHGQNPAPVSFELTGLHRQDPSANPEGVESETGPPIHCNLCHTPALAQKLSDTSENPDARAALVGRCYECHERQRPAVFHTWSGSDRCGDCHTPNGFAEPVVDHTAEATNFAIDATHSALRCTACHLADERGDPQRIRGECACCHTKDTTIATVQHFFPMRRRPAQPNDPVTERTACGPALVPEGPEDRDCDACHTGESFLGGQFDHAVWPLTGRHADRRQLEGQPRDFANCDSCHKSTDSGPLSTLCVDCHRPENATPPGRATAWPFSHRFGWPSDDGCTPCHSTEGFANPTFDHADGGTGGIALTGHDALGCDQCHLQRVEDERTSQVSCGDDAACHGSDFAAAAATAGHPALRGNCAECHEIRDAGGGWAPR
jgi:hypothetical protein